MALVLWGLASCTSSGVVSWRLISLLGSELSPPSGGVWGCMFPDWFPHCSEVPREFYSRGVPFCPFISPLITLGGVCLSSLPDCLFWSGVFLCFGVCFSCTRHMWYFLMFRTLLCVCRVHLSVPFSLHHLLGGSDSYVFLSIGDNLVPFAYVLVCLVWTVLPVPVLFYYCYLLSVQHVRFPSVFPDYCVGLFPIGKGCLPSFL